MNQEILTKCGYRCDLCLAYRGNVEKADERAKLSNGWFDFYGFRIEPEKIVCDGCVSCANPKLIAEGCSVRACVVERGLNNCAECDEYVCDKLKTLMVFKKAQEEKLGRKLTDDEYRCFLLPYESKPRLDMIRESLLNK